MEGLTAIARRSLNGATKHLKGVLIKGNALLKDITIDVDHTGTGDHETKGLSIDANTGACLASNVKIFAKAIEGTVYGLYTGSTSKATINGGQVELSVPAPAVDSVCTALTAVSGDEKKRFIDSTNPTPDAVPDDTFNTWTLFWTSGGNIGESQAILDWDTTLNEFTFANDFTNAIAVGDQYEIYINATDRVVNDDLHNAGGSLTVSEFSFDNTNTTGVINNLSPQVDASGRVDLGSINGSAATLTRFSKSVDSMITGTVDNSVLTPTATVFEADDITDTAADTYNGRIVIFTSGSLIRQAANIIDYELSGANGKFTVSGLTAAPANDDTFIII